jgi:protein tyrosine phosphatase (PTP) superfamily phosphohydrolase (DUF442 family)
LLMPEAIPPDSRNNPPPKITEPGESRSAKAPTGPPPLLPVGIPQFTTIKEGVAAGLRPSLDDGLDWLQTNGYRTVLHVRKPGEDDSADRKQVEKRGMIYLTLELSPDTLSRQIADDFNRTVAEKQNYPLFVYDRDGSLAGGLWYVYFRMAEVATDESARVRAGSLGFRPEQDDTHRAMWQAVQNLLKTSP